MTRVSNETGRDVEDLEQPSADMNLNQWGPNLTRHSDIRKGEN